MTDREYVRLVLDALEPTLCAAAGLLLDAHPLLNEEPLFIHPGRGRDPEEVADEVLRALALLHDALHRYRRITRVARAASR